MLQNNLALFAVGGIQEN